MKGLTVTIELNNATELTELATRLGAKIVMPQTTAPTSTEVTGTGPAKPAAVAKSKTTPAPAPVAQAAHDDMDLGFGEDTTPAPVEKKVKLEDVIQSFKVYTQKHDRTAAGKILGKYGVKSVRDLKADQFDKVIRELA